MVVGGVLAVVWTWSFALLATMAWNPPVTADAQATLRTVTIHHTRCHVVSTGSVGPLHTPYRTCATAGGSVPSRSQAIVEYVAMSGTTTVSPARGLAYIVGSSRGTLTDQTAGSRLDEVRTSSFATSNAGRG
jgi:hypothetical protein